VKVTHQLREAQRHTINVTRQTATGKFAMFIKMLERDEHWRAESAGPRTLMMPMTRTDIADYLGLSPEAVSRTTSRLVRRGILAFPDRHRVRILNPSELDRLAGAA
jgi:CRP/FNR family transcriptional regulator, anaerobic regulatory protein